MIRRVVLAVERPLALLMLAFVAVSWPLAAFTFAKDEPPFVVALSELALLYSAITTLQVAYRTTKDEDP